MHTNLFIQNNDAFTATTQLGTNLSVDDSILGLSTDDLVSTAGGSTLDWW
jgi:hypothetical protein